MHPCQSRKMRSQVFSFRFVQRSDDDNDFDKPDPLPEDPARVSRTELTKIRDCISKLLRNQDDEEAYTFRGMRNKVD